MPTSAAMPTAPATIAPVLRGFFAGAVIVGVAVVAGVLVAVPGLVVPPGGLEGVVRGAVAAGTGAGVEAGVATVFATQLLCPTGACHAGRGLQAGGVLEPRYLLAAVAVALPYLPSAVTPSAF